MTTARVLIVDGAGDPPLADALGALDAELVAVSSADGALPQALQGHFALIIVAGPMAAATLIVEAVRGNPATRHTPVLFVGAGADGLALPLAAPADYLSAPLAPALRARVQLFMDIDAAITTQRAETYRKVAHDLRTPLNAMLGWTSLLRSGRLDAETAERALETIERNAHTQKELIAELLDRGSAARS